MDKQKDNEVIKYMWLASLGIVEVLVNEKENYMKYNDNKRDIPKKLFECYDKARLYELKKKMLDYNGTITDLNNRIDRVKFQKLDMMDEFKELVNKYPEEMV